MATIYTQQDKNIRRTWLLMITFFVFIAGLAYLVSYYYGNPVIFYVAIVFSLLLNFFSYWYSDKVVISMTKAVPADREKYPELYRIVENLSITAGLPMPRVYIVNDPSPNAFATGRNKEKAVVAVTTGLLQILDRNELEGVIAHELAHIGNRDILLSTVIVVLVGLVAILSDIFLRGGFGSRNDNNRAGGLVAIIGLVLIILSPLIAKIIQLAISRKREFLADASAVLLTRYPEGLANALLKIEQHARPMQNASNATSHLFIANPFSGLGRKATNIFSTHPLTEDRVKAILGQTK